MTTTMAERVMVKVNSRENLKYYEIKSSHGVGVGIGEEHSSLLSIVNRKPTMKLLMF